MASIVSKVFSHVGFGFRSRAPHLSRGCLLSSLNNNVGDISMATGLRTLYQLVPHHDPSATGPPSFAALHCLRQHPSQLQHARTYAKASKGGKSGKKGKDDEGADKKGGKKAKAGGNQASSAADSGASDFDIAAVEENMSQSVDFVAKEISKLRGGRAQPGLLEGIVAEVYGTKMPIRDLATVGVRETQVLSVMPYDVETLEAIDKAIRQSPLGLNPRMGETDIVVPVPSLSMDQRQELGKMASQVGESGKSSIRGRRQDAMKALKTAQKAGMSEDEVRRFEKQVQAVTDNFVKEIESLVKAKNKELMEE